MRRFFYGLLAATLLGVPLGTARADPTPDTGSAALTVTRSGTGTGTVTAPGIECGSTCSESYPTGTKVVLTAVPDSGSIFTAWSGDCKGTGPCKATMSADESVDAVFDTGSCTYRISPRRKVLTYKGGTVTVGITAKGSASCPAPDISNAADWVTVTSTFAATRGTVKLTVPEYGSSIRRNGTVTIGGNTFTIIQDGEPCALALSAFSPDFFTKAGGTGQFTVTATPADCTWTATSASRSWIAIISGESGTGTGNVDYTVAAYAGKRPRNGNIRVETVLNRKSRSYKVKQLAVGLGIIVNWSLPQQTIDGFGGSAADFTSPLTSRLADFFFTTSGIGLSIVRTQIMPGLADCQAWMESHGAPASDCVTVLAGATSMIGEPLVAQQAAERGVRTFFASCWSPPASMKSNGVFYQGGNFIGNSTNYTSYAEALASYPAFMAGYGISIYAISPQNEPDISQTYPSALWTAQQFHDFIPYLNSAIGSSGYSPKIMFPENSQWSTDYAGFAATTMTDGSVAPDVGLLAQHDYGTAGNIAAPANYGRHVWMTEVSSQSATYDGSMTDALAWAQKIHNFLSIAQINAFVWWFLSDMPGNGSGTDNSALTDIDGNIPLRAYVTGNWSKFVRPGWVEVSVTNTGSLLVTAFKSADSSQSAVVIVNNGPSVSNQVFNVGTQMGTRVIPWITSSTRSLAPQGSVPVTSGSIIYTIPAYSVVTFVGPA